MSNSGTSSAPLLERLQDWYLRECNGDWEHSYGIKIETLDNPGWLVTVDLHDTPWERLVVERRIVERSETDWVQTEVANGKFVGCGGPKNLEEVLALFFQIVA
jgi:hypothetical protein